MADEGRTSGWVRWLAIGLLVVPLAVVGWWLSRPAAPNSLVTIDELDVLCTGRVDSSGMVVSLEPSQAGRVLKIYAQENKPLDKGQEILRLDDSTAKARLLQATAGVDGAKVDLASAEKEAQRFPEQLEARRALGAAAKARVDQAKKLVEQRKAQQQITPLTKIEQEGLEAQVRELESLELADRLQLADIEKNLNPQWRIDAAKARLDAAKADQQLAQKSVEDCVMRAPSAGRILRLQTSEGALLMPGGYPAAIVFVPAGPLVVRAELDQEFIGRVREGMTVEVRDDGRANGPMYPGRIKSMSRWVAQRRTMILDPGEINDVRTVECLVELQSSIDELFIGQRMRVRIKSK